MEKTKLCIPAALVAAAAWLLGLYSGYLITGILVGYVLLVEDSQWLKKQCLRVLTLMLAYSVLTTVLGFIPDLLHLLYNFLEIFNVHFYLEFVHEFFNFLSSILSLIKTVVFLLMGITAGLNKNFKIPGLDTVIDKALS